MRGYSPVRLAKAVIAVANERNVRVTAASVAFYVFNTAIPLALLVVVGLSYFGRVGLLDRAVGTIVGVLPGRVLAGFGWVVSAVFFRVYLSLSANPYGLAGAVLLFLSWLYVGGLLLLLGVVLNAVLGGHVEVDYDWLPGAERT